MKGKMTSRERVLTALNLGVPDRVPWVESYIHNSLASKILGRTVEAPPGARITPEIHKALALDNINFNFKAPLYAEMVKIGDTDNVRTPWLKTWDDLEKMKKWLPDNTKDDFYKNARDYLKYKGEFAAMVGINLGVAPTYNSMGYEDFIFNMMDEPEFVIACFDVIGEWTSRIIERINDMDYDMVFISEDIAFAQGPMVKPDKYKEIIYPFFKKMCAKINKPIVYHSDGNYTELMNYVLEYNNVKALANLEPPCTDIFKVKETFGKRACLFGNIDLHHTLTRGTVEETAAEVKEKLERVGKGGGYIVATSNGLAAYCKPENVVAMNDTILKFGHVK
jgi:hypothetical protein